MLNAIWAFMILLAVFYAACTGRMNDVTNAALDSAGEAISLCLTMAGVVALWMGLMEIAKKAGLIGKLTRGISPLLTLLFPGIPRSHPAREYIAANIIANVLGLGWACTPAGLKAMEELAKLEAQRGNPEYSEDGGETVGHRDDRYSRGPQTDNYFGRQSPGSHRDTKARGSLTDVASAYEKRRNAGQERSRLIKKKENADEGQREGVGRGRRASNEMCNFLILNISSLQLIPVNMIAYRAQYGSANPTAIIAPAIAATLFSSVVAVAYCKVKDRMDRGGKAV